MLLSAHTVINISITTIDNALPRSNKQTIDNDPISLEDTFKIVLIGNIGDLKWLM